MVYLNYSLLEDFLASHHYLTTTMYPVSSVARISHLKYHFHYFPVLYSISLQRKFFLSKAHPGFHGLALLYLSRIPCP